MNALRIYYFQIFLDLYEPRLCRSTSVSFVWWSSTLMYPAVCERPGFEFRNSKHGWSQTMFSDYLANIYVLAALYRGSYISFLTRSRHRSFLFFTVFYTCFLVLCSFHYLFIVRAVQLNRIILLSVHCLKAYNHIFISSFRVKIVRNNIIPNTIVYSSKNLRYAICRNERES